MKGYTKHHRALSKSQDHLRESESGFHREMSKISKLCEDDGGIVAMMKKIERPNHWDSFINFVSFFCLSAAPRLVDGNVAPGPAGKILGFRVF